MNFNESTEEFDPSRIMIWWDDDNGNGIKNITDVFETFTWNKYEKSLTATNPINAYHNNGDWRKCKIGKIKFDRSRQEGDTEPKIQTFDLSEIEEYKKRMIIETIEGGKYVFDVTQADYAIVESIIGSTPPLYIIDISSNFLNTPA